MWCKVFNHLFYVDDSLLFCMATQEEARHMVSRTQLPLTFSLAFCIPKSNWITQWDPKTKPIKPKKSTTQPQ